MNRRAAWFAGVGIVAAAAGVGGSMWRARHDASSGSSNADGAPDIWSMGFDNPRGGQLDLSAFRSKPLLLNFWATWCPPCVSEMPMLDRFHQAQAARGWNVVGLAVDNRDPVLEFLVKRPVRYPIGLAGLGGVDLSRRLGNSTGALPFTVVFNAAGTVIHRKLGVIDPDDLARWASA